MSAEFRAAAVLCDLDGTLVDSTALITRAWTRWAVEHGLTREAFAGVMLHGRPARDIVHDLLPDGEEEALHRIMTIEASMAGGVTTLPGADLLVRSMAPGEWAVVTSGSQAIAEPRLAAHPSSPGPCRHGRGSRSPRAAGASRRRGAGADHPRLTSRPPGDVVAGNRRLAI